MTRLGMFFRLAALAAAALGLYGFYRGVHPVGWPAWTVAGWQLLLDGFGRPLAPIAAAAALAAGLAARWLERRIPLTPVRARPHALSGAEAFHARGGPHDREALRWRLEALLRHEHDVVTFVDELLAGAIRFRASDVHLRALEGSTVASYRIDGVLDDVANVTSSFHEAIVRRIKVLARLVPYKSEEPQDGRLALDTPLGTADVRVSTVPALHGEKVVLRLVLEGSELRDLGALGMPEALRQEYEAVLAEPQGLLILTGPTGCGKTTTLYSSLDFLRRTRGSTTNVATLEDPIEVDLPFLAQTQIDRMKGLSFAAGLRAVLRQDPDVLMVGEIRDPETADIAIQAGLTGHLILTTLHAESTAGVFSRLIDAGVEPFLVASATLACVSQRLARRLCAECRRPASPSRAQRRQLARHGLDVEGRSFFESPGCSACAKTGHRGRIAIFEMLRVTPALRQLVTEKVPTDQLRRRAIDDGMTPLLAAALEHAAAGRVSLDEALRVAA